jgi:hypothetical protein
MKSGSVSQDILRYAASSHIMVLWSTEMSTKNLPEGKGRPAPKTEILTAISQPTV